MRRHSGGPPPAFPHPRWVWSDFPQRAPAHAAHPHRTRRLHIATVTLAPIPYHDLGIQQLGQWHPPRRRPWPAAGPTAACGSPCMPPTTGPSRSTTGPPGANDRFFTVRRNSESISACLPYRTAFKNKRIRETSPERGGIRWGLSSPLCPHLPRFSSLERVDNTSVGANRKFAGVCSWKATQGRLPLAARAQPSRGGVHALHLLCLFQLSPKWGMNPLIVTINSKGNVLLLPAVSHDMACRGPCDVVHGWEAPHILRA